MNSYNSRSRNMYQVVLNILQAFASLWSSYVPFADGVTEFKDDVKSIDDKKAIQEALLKGYALNKYSKKRDMATLSLIVCKKVRGYAADTGDIILYGKMKISFTKLYSLKDTLCISYAEQIYTAATAMLPADQTRYKISPAELTAMRSAIDVFMNLPSPEEVRSKRKTLTKDLNALFKTTTGVLDNKLDNLIAEFQITDPQFFSEYHNARRIFESHRHTTVEGVTIDAATGKDLQNVQVIIESSADHFEEMTDQQGEFKRQVEPEISYNLKFVLPDFEPQEFKNVKLKRGKHQKFDVKLIKA